MQNGIGEKENEMERIDIIKGIFEAIVILNVWPKNDSDLKCLCKIPDDSLDLFFMMLGKVLTDQEYDKVVKKISFLPKREVIEESWAKNYPFLCTHHGQNGCMPFDDFLKFIEEVLRG